eukprot:12202030-Alexandrium_andersonii.AAC.1
MASPRKRSERARSRPEGEEEEVGGAADEPLLGEVPAGGEHTDVGAVEGQRAAVGCGGRRRRRSASRRT